MPETHPSDDKLMATAGAGLCASSGTVDAWSRLFAALGIVAALLVQSNAVGAALSVACAIIGLAEAYCAIRLGFDRAIFDGWRREGAPVERLTAFDQTLVHLGLRSKPQCARSLETRLQGTARLFRFQVALLAVQLAAALASVLVLMISGRRS